ncbi:MAG TPA: hypothetical protein VFR41_09090 [Acidimicrobiia bacterium]|nr:hypothetical protein [Acidimicrobiia bacterium]
MDAPAVLEFFFDRVLMSESAKEFRRTWVLNLAGLLGQVERDGA